MNTDLTAHRAIEAEGERVRPEVIAGYQVASFCTLLEANQYREQLGSGFTVTADVFLGWAVRRLVSNPLSRVELDLMRANEMLEQAVRS